MSANSPLSLRFSFSTPTKAVMEFTGGSPDPRNEDIFSKCDLNNIQLFTYDWTISNYSMMKPKTDAALSPAFLVGPCKNFELKLVLSLSGDDNLKIELLLSKETKVTEEMKANEAKCDLTTKLMKPVLNLEFLDSSGKTIDYYKSLTYEFKYINTSKVYAWTKEENVSRFIYDDTLTIRAKLSMRYYSQPSSSASVVTIVKDEKNVFSIKPVEVNEKKNLFNNTEGLMKDMKSLFNDRNRFPDVVIKVGGQFVLSHKSILYTQCPSFIEIAEWTTDLISTKESTKDVSSLKLPSYMSDMVGDDYELLYIPNESASVFLSVLHFIYCKQLNAADSVDDFAVYDFAKKYGVRELSMLLMPKEIKVRSEVKVENLTYTWYVKNFSSLHNGGFSPTQSPEFKTNIGNETITWSIVLFYLDSQNIILSLQRINGVCADVLTAFKLAVCKADGSIHDERKFKHLFTAGAIKNCHPGFIESVSRFLITPDLLYNDTLAVCCDLTASAGELLSVSKYCYPGEYNDIDLAYWVNNFQNLLEKQDFSDATLKVEEKEFKVHKAILSARSPVFARMFESDMEEKLSGCVRIEDTCSAVMEKALSYMYTGKIVDLTMAHAPDLYRVADKYEVMDLKTSCSKFMMHNLDAESSCEILIIADLYNDEKLKKAAKNEICRNSSTALLSPHGIELMTDHPHLARDVLETLSTAFCSLPPQEALVNSFKPWKRVVSPTSGIADRLRYTRLNE